jgi:DNA-binding NarL/FixJ family response regulator
MRDSANGRSPMTPSVAVRLKTLLSPENKTDFIVAKEITSFEMRIIECIAEGKSYQASARELSIGIDEVTASIRNIYLKIQGKLNANK